MEEIKEKPCKFCGKMLNIEATYCFRCGRQLEDKKDEEFLEESKATKEDVNDDVIIDQDKKEDIVNKKNLKIWGIVFVVLCIGILMIACQMK